MVGTERRLVDFGGDAALQLSLYEDPPSFDALNEVIPWQHSVTNLFGNTIQTGRLVCTMGAPYSYNGQRQTEIVPMPEPVADVCNTFSAIFGIAFNTCVANLYPDGSVGLGSHDDGEKFTSIIVSLSVGATRKMTFHKKDKTESHAFVLEHGTICAMCGEGFQRDWKHSIPKMKCESPRISLTFRAYYED